MWDTAVMTALNEVMRFTSNYGDLCPPLKGPSQKTTNKAATKYWVQPASKCFNKMCPHPGNAHKSLRSDPDATTVFATAETGVYTSGLCRELVLVAMEGEASRARNKNGDVTTLYVN